eukprot:5798712-Amphidinium_carterae.1
MEGSESTERERHLDAVRRSQSYDALGDLPERYRGDREIVLTAVEMNGAALEYAADACKRDREIVLTAIRGSHP